MNANEEARFQLDVPPDPDSDPLPGEETFYLYYAHSKRIYNTQEEIEQMRQIALAYPEMMIVNPNAGVRPRLDGESEMDPFLEAVRGAALVVVTEYMDHVGRGVFAEVCQAFVRGIPVEVLRHGQIVRVAGITLTEPDDWAINFAQLITWGG